MKDALEKILEIAEATPGDLVTLIQRTTDFTPITLVAAMQDHDDPQRLLEAEALLGAWQNNDPELMALLPRLTRQYTASENEEHQQAALMLGEAIERGADIDHLEAGTLEELQEKLAEITPERELN